MPRRRHKVRYKYPTLPNVAEEDNQSKSTDVSTKSYLCSRWTHGGQEMDQRGPIGYSSRNLVCSKGF